MAIYGRVLRKYEEIASRSTDSQLRICCDGLLYKHNLIAFNVCMDQHRLSASPSERVLREHLGPILRSLIQHEIDYEFDFEQQNYKFILFPPFPPHLVLNRAQASRSLASMSDAEIAGRQLTALRVTNTDFMQVRLL